MAGDEAVLVLDCGATNLRAVAVSASGEILAQASRPNASVLQAPGSEMRIWDFDEIWGKLCATSREAISGISDRDISGTIVATWGADGAPVRPDGSLAYPIISWQCGRTAHLAPEIGNELSPWRIFRISGYQVISFNTLLRLIWLRRNVPESLSEENRWLAMPGLIAARLGAKPHIDPTSASTSMAMDLAERDWSKELLAVAELGSGFFPEWAEPGEIIGEVCESSSRETGLPVGTPILVGGHDTQFAVIGSGARREEAILSSGTWEILASRVERFRPNRQAFRDGLIFEADALPGLWDPQILMMGSGVLEWVRSGFFKDLPPGDYRTLIDLARIIPAGSHGVTFVPSFVSDSGPARRHATKGTILGLGLHTRREEVYRAALEGLSFQLRMALKVLSSSTTVAVNGIRVVGGGSKNELWNQIRADVCGLPVTVTSHQEATVLGAAMVAFVGLGRYSSVKAAMEGVKMQTTCYLPSDRRSDYDKLYRGYARLPGILRSFYAPPVGHQRRNGD